MLEKEIQIKLSATLEVAHNMDERKDSVESRYLFVTGKIREALGFVEGYIEGKEKDGNA